MTLTRDEMLRRFLARDRKSDGLFVTGVLTTGIYCLPSCSARKPRPENVRFFPDPEAARRTGLRACKRCRPADFYRGHDPDRALASELARRVRRAPGEFPDAAALARAAGVGGTKLQGLFREHFHATPAQFLQGARVAWAERELATTARRVVDVALDAGYESSSAFHEAFQRRTGLSPGAFRRLPAADAFALSLPADFRSDEVRSIFARSVRGLAERVTPNSIVKAARLGGATARLEIEWRAGGAACRVEGRRGPETMRDAHRLAVRLLGLAQDPAGFERRMLRRGLGRLVKGRRGLRVPLTADAFEALVWVVLGQQVNVAFASACRERLVELAGVPAGAGMRVHPTAREVARLDVGDLRALKLTARKAEYLVEAARAVEAGRLDLEGLAREPARTIEERLSSIRGLGPWSVRYLLMRSYGLADCVPVGDVALTASLQEFHGLAARPDAETTEELMRPFAPDRSLATFHLWKRLGDPA